MPEDKKLILAKGSGVVTGNDVIEHLNSLAADNRYRAPMKKLIDYRSIDGINISADEARKIAQKKQSLISTFHGKKCAFASPGDLTYGTSRVHKTLISSVDVNTAVLRQIEDALDWLDITDMNLE